jgi:REP element-mobilizing transposase RayT
MGLKTPGSKGTGLAPLFAIVGNPHRLTPDAYVGAHAYFLTICTHRRRCLFQSASAVDLVRSQFLHTARCGSFQILVDCFMPDHVHAVVVGQQGGQSLPRFVRLAKQRSGYAFVRRFHGRLWQESYFDRTIRRDEALARVVAYVVNNPIRRGLVSAPMEYPFWGSGVYTREEILEFIGAPGV